MLAERSWNERFIAETLVAPSNTGLPSRSMVRRIVVSSGFGIASTKVMYGPLHQLSQAGIDGTFIRQVIFPLDGPNGVGLSPDDDTLYVSESWSGRVWAYEVTGPGQIRKFDGPMPWERGRLLAGMSGYSLLDSMAIDAEGNVCVADIPFGGISVIRPDGTLIERHPLPDPFVTNICFGGAGLRTAYLTLSSTGRLASMPWPRAGLPLHCLNRHQRAPVFAPGED